MCPNGGKTNFRSLYFRSGVNLRPEVLSAEDFRPLYFRPSSREKYVIGHPRGRPGRKSSKLVYYRSRVYKILSETFRADIDNLSESFYTNTPLLQDYSPVWFDKSLENFMMFILVCLMLQINMNFFIFF